MDIPPIPIMPTSPTMAWPNPLGGNVHIPPYPPHSLESLVASLASLLAPFMTPNTLVAIYRLPQSTTLPIFFAISRLQAIPVFLNDRYTLSDVSRALTAVPTTALLTKPLTTTDIHAIQHAVPLILTLTNTHSPFQYTVTPSPSRTHANSRTQILPEQTAVVFFTSGTTSTPKPVPLTYQNLTSQSLSKVSYLQLSTSTIYLHLAPLYHLAGFSSTLAVTLSKATHVLPQDLHPSNPTHAANLLSLVREYAISLLVAVPATLRLILDAAADRRSLPSVKTILYGGSAASDTLLKDLNTTFPNSATLGAYGMTETASSLTISCGKGPSRPLRHVRLAILRDDGGIIETGVGEVLTKGPHVFPGYCGHGKESFIQGWFRTGDIGKLTHHGLTLLGRKVEMIKSGGEKVYAGEVESVLMRYFAVREAAVVGVPDRILGETVAACVVLVGDKGNDMIQALRGFCKNALAHFKCPRWILATDELPRNATGKVIKARVREILAKKLRPRAKL